LVRLQADQGVLKVVWGDGPKEQCEAAYKLEKAKSGDREFSRVKLMCFKPEAIKEAMNQTGSPPVLKP
jgi:outer membrane usher protein FimD/PapC